jgi:hypothetical protein
MPLEAHHHHHQANKDPRWLNAAGIFAASTEQRTDSVCPNSESTMTDIHFAPNSLCMIDKK